MRQLSITILIAALALAIATDLHAKRKVSKPEKPAVIRLKTIPGGCSVVVSGIEAKKLTEEGKWLELRLSKGKQPIVVWHDTIGLSFEVTASDQSIMYTIANVLAGRAYAGSSPDSIDSLPCETITNSWVGNFEVQPCDGSTMWWRAVDTSKVRGVVDSLENGEWIPLEIMPEMIQEVRPEYPRLAKQAQMEGKVRLSIKIDKTGGVALVCIAQTSKYKILDAAATKAAYQCKYKPSIQNGRPVVCWITYPVHFVLDDR